MQRNGVSTGDNLVLGRDGGLVELGEFLHDGVAPSRSCNVRACHAVLQTQSNTTLTTQLNNSTLL